jgi:hypothetical protein
LSAGADPANFDRDATWVRGEHGSFVHVQKLEFGE